MSETAVANFFTPVSQKPPEKTVWNERAPNEDSHNTLLVGRYLPANFEAQHSQYQIGLKIRKVAAFDFVGHWKSGILSDHINKLSSQDSTLIQTLSGKKHASEAQDWKWWHLTVPGTLKTLCIDEG